MAKILLAYRVEWGAKRTPIETYSRSFHRELENLGHEVTPVGEGHPLKGLWETSELVVKQHDLFIDLDCGRNSHGELHFQCQKEKAKIPSAVWFVDSHGYPSLHRRSSKNYDHVFFAVWDKRDLFDKHPSTEWCPNSSDIRWFNYLDHASVYVKPKFHIGFFGTKGGLDRADPLRNVIARHSDLNCDIREVGRQGKPRWPRTAEAMCNCMLLYNVGQKHDGPNQRVIESMLCRRPLINKRDKRDGMGKLFEEGEHYLGWESESELFNQIDWCRRNSELSKSMADRAYKEARAKHQIKNRVELILEKCFAAT